jgi:hypothetical protein
MKRHVALAMSIVLDALWLVGCTADGSDDPVDEDAGSDAVGAPADGARDGESDHRDASSLADASQDATVDVVGADAFDSAVGQLDTGPTGSDGGLVGLDVQVLPDGSDAGMTGSLCAPENAIQQQGCGFCGFQQRVCLPNDVDDASAGGDDGGEGGPLSVWQAWGFCQNQPAGGCAPGTQTTEPCGLCGHHTKVCQLDCQWAVGPCTGEPPSACAPGATNFVGGLSCDAGGRQQTCQQDCTWGPFGGCVVPTFGAPLTISGVPGGVITALENMPESPTLSRLFRSTCPTTIFQPGSKNAFAWIELDNPTSLTATVSVWFSQATGGAAIDTEIAVYAGNTIPATDAARESCTFGVSDSCTSSIPTACKAGWGGLVSGDALNPPITMPPNSSVMIYAGAINEVTSTLPHSGVFILSARTESLQ